MQIANERWSGWSLLLGGNIFPSALNQDLEESMKNDSCGDSDNTIKFIVPQFIYISLTSDRAFMIFFSA